MFRLMFFVLGGAFKAATMLFIGLAVATYAPGVIDALKEVLPPFLDSLKIWGPVVFEHIREFIASQGASFNLPPVEQFRY